MLDDGVGNDNVAFAESDLCANLGDEILLRNLRLIFLVVAACIDAIHSVEENWIDFAFIVVTEDEETLAQVKIDFRKITVVELLVLTRVGKVREDTDDFLAFCCLTNLV